MNQIDDRIDIQQTHGYLISRGIRPSVQRVAIMHYLWEHATHPTIDRIFGDLLPSIPTLSKTTVYNTLKLFEEEGLVLALTIDEKNVRYDGNTDTHAHFRCRKCGVIHDIPLAETEVPGFEGSPTLHPDEVQVYYLGVCENCR